MRTVVVTTWAREADDSLVKQLVDVPGYCKLKAWASADARDSNMVHRNKVVPTFVPYRSEH